MQVQLAGIMVWALFSQGRSETHTTIFENVSPVFVASSTIHLTLDLEYGLFTKQCKVLTQALERARAVNPPLARLPFYETVRHRLNSTCETAAALSDLSAADGHVVNKRQLGMIAAGVATLFGVYTHFELSHLSNKVTSLAGQEHRDFVLIKQHETRIAESEKAIELSNKAVTGLIDIVANHTKWGDCEFWLLRMNAHVAVLEAHVNAFSGGLALLVSSKRLGLTLLGAAQVKRVWRRLRRKLTENRSVLPMATMLDFLQFPASFHLLDMQRLQIFVHVPVVTSTLTLYRYVSFPLQLQQGNTTLTVEVLHPGGRDHLISSSEHDYHVEVSEDELSRMCFWIDEARICDNLGAMSSKPSDTCLGALSTGQLKDIKDRCITVVSTRDWAVEKTGDGWYMVYLRDAHLVRVVCQNGTITGTTMKGYKHFPVEVGCGLSSPRFNINPSRMLDMRMSVMLHVEWSVPDLLDGNDVAKIASIREDLMRRSVRPDEAVSALLDQAVAWAPTEVDLQTHVMSGTSAVATVIVVGIVGFLLYRYRKQTTPSVTPS
jgi:hypothetical protein